MLNDLKFLDPGQRFPPECEHERMQMYSDNRALFEGEHARVYKKVLERIERVVDNFENVISYPVIANFQRLMSLKIADLLLGETPKITVDKEFESEQATINKIIENSGLFNIAYQVAIDVSRYGDGLFLVCIKNGKAVIDLTQPPIWYPIVDPKDVHTVIAHVLAWNIDETTMEVHIHTKGSVEKRTYTVDHGYIVEMTESTPEPTGLSDFAVIQVSNVLTSDRCCGLDDYTDLDSIISDLMVRIGQIDRILDKHASPSMSGPQTALEKDPLTGLWRFKAGDYFVRESADDADVAYIVWNAQLDANFKQIERLINLLYSISEMGSALFGDMTATSGNIPSGSALRRLMLAPLAKVNRIKMRFDPALKLAMKLCSELGTSGITALTDADISVKWFDGLPMDASEDATILASRTGNKATMSQVRGIMEFDGLSQDKAEEELAIIQDEESVGAPMQAPPMAQIHANEQLPLGTPGETTPNKLMKANDLTGKLRG